MIYLLKSLLVFLIISSCSTSSSAQVLKELGNRVKDKVKEKLGQKADQTTENTMDSTFSKVDKSLKKAVKGKNKEEAGSQGGQQETLSTDNGTQAEKTPAGPADLGVYRKFAFVRGSKIILQDAFEEDEVGDYPKRWNSDAGGEVVSLNKLGGKWLKSPQTSNHYVDYIKTLPLNFTFEFDLLSDAKSRNDFNELSVTLASTKGGPNFSNTLKRNQSSSFKVDLRFYHTALSYENNWDYSSDTTNATFLKISSPTDFDLTPFNYSTAPLHVSLVRQDQRLVLYLNTTRIFDVRNAFAKNTELNNILFNTYSKLDNAESGLYFSNLLLAETVTDNRKDLFVEGKFVTNAILFETNSDRILPSSLPAVRIIADYLNTNPSVKVLVIGHTDSQGEDAANLSLSEKRAQSVMKELIDNQGINASRLRAQGKGESQPIGNNATPEGRAQNRRVEFVKE